MKFWAGLITFAFVASCVSYAKAGLSQEDALRRAAQYASRSAPAEPSKKDRVKRIDSKMKVEP